MPGLSRSETHRLLEHIEPQGVRITPTKNGQLLRLPDGSSTVVHYSVSDHRGPQKLKAQLKRAGVTWMTDKHDNTRRGKPYPATIQAMEAALARLGNPATKVRSSDLMHTLQEVAPGLNRASVRRYMLWTGWEPRGKTQALVWHRPKAEAEVVPFPEWVDETPTPAPELAAVEAAPEPTPDPAPEEAPLLVAVAPGGREFIDSVASWTVDLDALADMPLGDVRRVLQAAGVALEVRVWRG